MADKTANGASGPEDEYSIVLPESLLNLGSSHSSSGTTLQVKTEDVLDGVAILAQDLNFVCPEKEVRFQISNNKTKMGHKYKGFRRLSEMRVYSVKLCRVGFFDVNLLYGTTVFTPDQYICESKLKHRVEQIVAETLLQLNVERHKSSLHGSSHHDDFASQGGTLSVMPEDFLSFTKLFRKKIVDFYGTYCKSLHDVLIKKNIPPNELNHNVNRYPEKVGLPNSFGPNNAYVLGEQPFVTRGFEKEKYGDYVFFYLERFGNDQVIPFELQPSDDPVARSTQCLQAAEFLRPLARNLCFPKDVTDEDLCIVFHFATDYSDNSASSSDLLFWNIEEVNRTLKYVYDTFYVFAIPGIGNLQAKPPIAHHVQFYTQFGKQIHRNVNGWFTKYCITEGLVALLGSKVFHSSRKPVETQQEKFLQNGKPVEMLEAVLNNLIQDTSAGSARFELNLPIMVFDIAKELSNPINLTVAFLWGLFKYQHFCETKKLKDSNLLVAVTRKALHERLQQILKPAAETIKKAIQQLKENPTGLLEMCHTLHMTEFLASFMLTGRRLETFYKVYEKDVGLDQLPDKTLGENFVLKQVRSSGDSLIFSPLIPPNVANFNMMMKWIFKKLKGNSCPDIYNNISIATDNGRVQQNSDYNGKSESKRNQQYLLSLFGLLGTAPDFYEKKESSKWKAELNLGNLANKVETYLEKLLTPPQIEGSQTCALFYVRFLTVSSFIAHIMEDRIKLKPSCLETLIKNTITDQQYRYNELVDGPETPTQMIVAGLNERILSEKRALICLSISRQSSITQILVVVPDLSSFQEERAPKRKHPGKGGVVENQTALEKTLHVNEHSCQFWANTNGLLWETLLKRKIVNRLPEEDIAKAIHDKLTMLTLELQTKEMSVK